MKNKNWKFKVGLIIILLSLPFFALLVIIPLLDIDSSDKIKFTSISFIIAEVLFYSGGFLLGKEIFNKYKSWFNPKNWFKKKLKEETVKDDNVD
ncbi:MAG: hypothetical protein DRI73_06490 [Bacteroidetes bacterium]|nr:MAG: hypothetical protein DRI73_06490 [Bacteroidota bacterium]